MIASLLMAACGSSKKGTTSAAASASPVPLAKPANGIYAPGNEELTAIQAQYKEATLDQLKEGHAIYTGSSCIRCHSAQNIYQYGEAQWKDIIEEMARKARISDVQKDAVYKYVLAIKAAQANAAK